MHAGGARKQGEYFAPLEGGLERRCLGPEQRTRTCAAEVHAPLVGGNGLQRGPRTRRRRRAARRARLEQGQQGREHGAGHVGVVAAVVEGWGVDESCAVHVHPGKLLAAVTDVCACRVGWCVCVCVCVCVGGGGGTRPQEPQQGRRRRWRPCRAHPASWA